MDTKPPPFTEAEEPLTTRNVSSYDDYGMTCDRNVTKSMSL